MRTTNDIRESVQKSYSAVAERKTSCCSPVPSENARTISTKIGYERETLDAVPEDANLGLGCGNPNALASLQPGETVVDLGAGAGLDALIAANAVGHEGRVIGVDMTQAMLSSARKNAVEMNVQGHVEFREGYIEDLPVASQSADVVISNCVINLSPDKPKAFREAFRVLKSGGRLAVSDIVLSEPLPAEFVEIRELYDACIAGAASEEQYLGAIEEAGFDEIEFTRVPARCLFINDASDPLIKQAVESFGQERVDKIADSIWSYKITAKKP